MKLILVALIFTVCVFSQNKKLTYKMEKQLTEDELVFLNKFCAKNKKIFSFMVDSKNKTATVETRGVVNPKDIDAILKKTGFKFISEQENLAKTSTVNSETNVR